MQDERNDASVLARIKQLVAEEHALLSAEKRDESQHARAEAIQVELDQAWDLLRQRRALREFGGDPDQAKVRPPNVVENYKQ
jgi:hypothetical protein